MCVSSVQSLSVELTKDCVFDSLTLYDGQVCVSHLVHLLSTCASSTCIPVYLYTCMN